jgi:hypothetical protein
MNTQTFFDEILNNFKDINLSIDDNISYIIRKKQLIDDLELSYQDFLLHNIIDNITDDNYIKNIYNSLLLLSYLNKNNIDSEYIKEIMYECYKLIIDKNTDYSGIDKPFKNFEIINVFNITAENGIKVRICDKISRINNLLKNDAQVKNESITDTLMDLINYSNILMVYLKNKEQLNE